MELMAELGVNGQERFRLKPRARREHRRGKI